MRAEIQDRKGGLAPVKIYRFEQVTPVDPSSDPTELKVNVETQNYKQTLDHKSGGKKLNWWSRHVRNIFSFLGGIFLPEGYPETVSKDYLNYQLWDTVQGMAAALASMFATEAVLKAIGVGNSNATALAAATTQILRNGSAWLGEIGLTWFNGRAFGYNNKKWRLFADVLLNIVRIIDMTSPLFPSWAVIYVLCTSSLLNAFVSIAGRATRVSVIDHQSLAGNIADVVSKDNSQGRAISLISMFISLIILPMISGRLVFGWIVFGTCGLIHIAATFMAIRTLRFKGLNEARFLHCIKKYIRDKSVPTIQAVNIEESYVMGLGISAWSICGMAVRVGVPLAQALKVKSSRGQTATTEFHIQTLSSKFEGKPFWIVPYKRKRFDIVLHEGAMSSDIMEAYFRAVYSSTVWNIDNYNNSQNIMDTMDSSVNEEWLNFKNMMQKEGYDLNNFDMDMRANRITLSANKEK